MSDWKVKKESSTTQDVVMNMATAGIKPMIENMLGIKEDTVYTVENEKTHEVREVTARDSDELGSKIEKGDFDDDD